MKGAIDVNTGEVKTSTDDITLRSIAIGSCIIVAAYDPVKKVGGLAHIMLPGKSPKNNDIKTKYAEDGIETLFELMAGEGTNRKDVQVCLVGGGNVLEKPDDTICGNNIISVTSLLEERQIPVSASVLGGMDRKSVFLDVISGRISYTISNKKEKVLWRPKKPQNNKP